MAKLEGTKLGAYEIIERVGGGGMAEVYLAKQHTAFDREVAIKVIRKGFAEDEDFRERFLREARVISHLNHPHILPLIEFGEGGENSELLFLVMPYVSGGTLRDRIKTYGGALPLRETFRIFSQLCEAVDYAHQRNLVHRDIKPSNVLMQDNRNILLADFGIALDFGDPRLTVTGMGLGTAEYMAPEQARGQADKRSDVYSLGVVLFVMLSGHAPFTGSTPFDVLMKQAAEPVPPLRDFNPGVPPAIEHVMQTAMAKLPEQRFQSAQALLNAFEEAQVQSGMNMAASNVMPIIRPSDLIPSRDSSHPSAGGGTPSTPSGGSVLSAPTPASSSGPHTPPTGQGASGPHSTPAYTNANDQLPTLRVGASGQHPAVTPADLQQATGLTQMEATHQAPSSSGPSGNQFYAPSGAMGMAASNPAMPAVYPGMPLSNPPTPAPPGVIMPTPPPPTRNNKKVIALIAALVILLIGSFGTVAYITLHNGSNPTPTTTGTRVPTASATQKPAALTFTAGTPCSAAAANPAGPAQTPADYMPAVFISGGMGAPAFVAVHNDGTLYYTDQQQPGIYGLSAALPNKNNHSVGPAIGIPSGIAITPDSASQVYYIYQAPASGKAIEQVGVFLGGSTSPLAGLNEAEGGGGNGFALALNPSNNALLIPNGATGTLYCLGVGNAQPQPVITGLKDPVAAIADSSGNIYVADMGANEILRFPPKGTGPDWRQPFNAPADLVLDTQGYLLATLQGTSVGDGSVVRINPTTGKQVTVLMASLQQPRGIAFDTSKYHSGTIYFTDQAANRIYALCQSHNGIC